MKIFNWFKKKDKKKEYIDIGTGQMYFTLKNLSLHDNSAQTVQGYTYTGFLNEGAVVHAKYTLEAQFRTQSASGFFKLKDGDYINKDQVSTVSFATDSFIIEKL